MKNMKSAIQLKSEYNNKANPAICLLIIISVNWIANFWNYSDFGLYIDDYTRVPTAMALSHGTFLDKLHFIFSADPRIRPLHKALINFLSLLGNAIGGLPGIYLVGFFISTSNAILFYFLLRRIVDLHFFALAGALAFCLYPVSTTKIWITSLLGIQPALTLLLLALHLYLSDRKILSFIIMTISLYCYETIFPVFMAAPLLKRIWGRDLFNRLMRHISVSAIIFIAFFVLKVLFPDPRLGNLAFSAMLQKTLYNSIAGPFHNIREHLLIPIKNLLDLPAGLIALHAGSFIFLSLVFVRIGSGIQIDPSKEIHRKSLWFGPDIVNRLVKGPLPAGFFMLAIGYCMTFYGNVHHITGISSRIHTAAQPGMALIIAAIGVGLLHFFSSKRKAYLPAIMIALLFSSFITYNFRIQLAYVASHNLQRDFWSEVTELCPDATEGTLILVESTGLKKSLMMDSAGWSVSRILDKIYQFPHAWQYPPRVYLINALKKDHTLSNNAIVTADSVAGLEQSGLISELEPEDINRKFDLGNTIILVSENGSLCRLERIQNTAGETFVLKVKSARTMDIDKGVLFYDLVRTPAKK